MSLHVGAKANVYECVCVKHVRGSEFIYFIHCCVCPGFFCTYVHFSSVFYSFFLRHVRVKGWVKRFCGMCGVLPLYYSWCKRL